jgi:hypothetical protein
VSEPLAAWHKIVENRDLKALTDLLDENAVMISPVVFTPQKGRKITLMYLTAAFHVLANDSFKYVREIADENGAVLEFETEVDGIYINGVDMIRWNEQGLITEFKVMVRPLQALTMLQKKMAQMLERL